MDCTLVFVCILKNENKAIIGHLGDSAICIIGEKKSIAINDGNRSANGTNALLDNDAIDHFCIRLYDLNKLKIQGFILTSDGLENELYMKGSDYVNQAAEIYFNAWYHNDKPITIIQDRIKKLTEIEGTPFDDDISIVVLSRANKAIQMPEDPTWLCTCGYRNNLQVTYCQKCNKDFSVLYQNIKFKNYGGKAAFFSRINQTPSEERRIISLPTNTEKKEGCTSGLSDISDEKGNEQIVANESIAPKVDANTPDIKEVSDSAVINDNALNRCKTNVGDVSGYHTFDNMGMEECPPVVTSNQHKQGGDIQTSANIGDYQNNNGSSNNNNQIAAINTTGKSGFPDSSTTEYGKKALPTNKDKKNKRIIVLKDNGLLLRVMICITIISLFVGIIIGASIDRRTMTHKIEEQNDKIQELNKKLKKYQEQGDKKVNALPDSVHVLDGGEIFFGDIDQYGKPHGQGIMIVNDAYYVGTYVNGMKEGLFVILGERDEPYIVEYKNDEQVTEHDAEKDNGDSSSNILDDNSYEVRYISVNLRDGPGIDNDSIGILEKGTHVYLYDDDSVNVYGEEWVHIKTENGDNGWILKDAIS